MAKFLNTSATTYHLEELIKFASERLFIISPFLRFNDRIRELLEDKNRLKIDIRIIYGKNELQPAEINWLKSLEFVRVSYCKNLHAKCYLNERVAIITSMNLYDFSQVNNNEMGVLIERESDAQLFMETYQEAQRLVRVSDEVKITVEKITRTEETVAEANGKTAPASAKSAMPPASALPQPAAKAGATVSSSAAASTEKKVSTSQVAKLRNLQVKEVFSRLQAAGWIDREGESWVLTKLGTSRGGELRTSPQFGTYIVWPESLQIP